ncbi:M67 family metallopeptidase [Nodosilinea sp. LEGE 06152]|uniref:M67 family metallopeptidase n=1 Tax=Nodosilinea sp. LEGE 06152 TaxID=2777966 RepID=UPI001882804C|nr:M67 family metallopeptidase [Nodosilinea sp. LEGE 06152]MBE9159257.1 M67 family metallopeptidase [Nodosilinea sp. LEGE 06152]
MTALHIEASHLQAIAQAVTASYPHEGCGLLLGRRVFAAEEDTEETYRAVADVVPLANAWEPSLLDYTDAQRGEQGQSQRDRYWIDPADLLAVQRSAREQGLEIIGVYHSHPDHPAVPSECDRALAWPVYSYLIVSVGQGEATDLKSWRLDDQDQFRPEPVKMIGSPTNKAPFLS